MPNCSGGAPAAVVSAPAVAAPGVSPASVTTDGPTAFRAHVEIADTVIRVDGHLRPLLAGMTGQAEVVVGRRPLIAYAFEPLRQLRENLAAAPEASASPPRR